MRLGLLHPPWVHDHMISPCYASIGHSSDAFVLNLASYERESFINILASFGWCFEELHAMFSCKSSALFRVDCLGLIAFVGDKHTCHIRGSMLFDLFDPILDVIEWILVWTVIGKNDAHSTAVIGLRNGSESFLSCSVPDLKLHYLVVNIHCLDFKINPYAC